MAIISDTLAGIKSNPLALLGGAECVDQCFAAAGHVWRERVLTPARTMKLFILQILHGTPPSVTCVTCRISTSRIPVTATREPGFRWREWRPRPHDYVAMVEDALITPRGGSDAACS